MTTHGTVLGFTNALERHPCFRADVDVQPKVVARHGVLNKSTALAADRNRKPGHEAGNGGGTDCGPKESGHRLGDHFCLAKWARIWRACGLKKLFPHAKRSTVWMAAMRFMRPAPVVAPQYQDAPDGA